MSTHERGLPRLLPVGLLVAGLLLASPTQAQENPTPELPENTTMQCKRHGQAQCMCHGTMEGMQHGQRKGQDMQHGRMQGRHQGEGMQHGQGMHHGKQGHTDHAYDPNTIDTITGTIERIDRIPMETHQGLHVVLADDTTVVHLGPDWFFERQEPMLQPGDEIEVTGSRVTAMGQPALIAAKVVRGDDTLVLRDEAGHPVWKGWRKR